MFPRPPIKSPPTSESSEIGDDDGHGKSSDECNLVDATSISAGVLACKPGKRKRKRSTTVSNLGGRKKGARADRDAILLQLWLVFARRHGNNGEGILFRTAPLIRYSPATRRRLPKKEKAKRERESEEEREREKEEGSRNVVYGMYGYSREEMPRRIIEALTERARLALPVSTVLLRWVAN